MLLGLRLAKMGGVVKEGTMSDFSAFIPHVYREDLLRRAVASVPEYHENLSIIDNSPYGLFDNYRVSIFRPPVPLTCSQTFNLIMRITRERGQKICIWMHSDAEAGPGVAEALLSFVRQYTAEGREWGVLWTYYDTLCALNTELLDVIGDWDTTLPQYYCDTDWYYRVKLAGWECIDTNLTDVKHEGSATINSSPFRKLHNSVTFPLYRQYYLSKWGGDPGQEKFTRPFNL